MDCYLVEKPKLTCPKYWHGSLGQTNLTLICQGRMDPGPDRVIWTAGNQQVASYYGSHSIGQHASVYYVLLNNSSVWYLYSSVMLEWRWSSSLGIEANSFSPDISIAPLQVYYYSEELPTTAYTLFWSFTPNREWRTCPRSLLGGKSGIRTRHPADARRRPYHWATTSHWNRLLVDSVENCYDMYSLLLASLLLTSLFNPSAYTFLLSLASFIISVLP